MIRLMRGQVVVRELEEKSPIWRPDPSPRQVKTHRGEVLALGKPAQVQHYDTETQRSTFHEIPHGFKVGDVVQFHFEHHQEGWTVMWEDGKKATYLAQHNVDAVIE